MGGGVVVRWQMLAHRVKSKVEALDRDNDSARERPGQGPGSANERTRSSITGGLRRKLKDLMGDFSDLRTQMQSEYPEVVKQRVYTVTGARRRASLSLCVENTAACLVFYALSCTRQRKSCLSASCQRRCYNGSHSHPRAHTHTRTQTHVHTHAHRLSIFPLASPTPAGQHLADEEVDAIIDKGEAETIFQKAIQEQVRPAPARVCVRGLCLWTPAVTLSRPVSMEFKKRESEL